MRCSSCARINPESPWIPTFRTNSSKDNCCRSKDNGKDNGNSCMESMRTAKCCMRTVDMRRTRMANILSCL